MEREEFLKKNQRILYLLNQLPKKMLALHGAENVTDFVLHDLCNKDCFNLSKAAYFVDNPDFDCLKGVAGYCAQETYPKSSSLWESPEDFNNYMSTAPFHQKVRSISQPSRKKMGGSDQDLVIQLADQLNLQSPQYCSWNMKHDNHGLFVYEGATDTNELLNNGVCLLSFCPIY